MECETRKLPLKFLIIVHIEESFRKITLQVLRETLKVM